MKRVRSLSCLLVLLAAFLSFAQTAFGQAYTSIVVFGDSLSDVGNDAALSYANYGAAGQVPGPLTGYTNGRFTDGLDTLPAARLYSGVWIEQLAAMLAAKPPVTNSLAKGTDYAYGFATTNAGTSPFTYGPGNALSFTVNNMGQQVTDYLATSPTINNKVLFVVWGGANDLIAATTTADIVNAAARDAGIIQRLITAGATNFIVPVLPPLGLIPRFNGSAATSAQVTAASTAYNSALSANLAQLSVANAGKPLVFAFLDTATLFNTIVASPAVYGFANVTASSQLNAAVNPDTYLFWDDLHPTTAGHHLIATTAFRLLGTPLVTNTALALSSSTSNLGSAVTFTATVTNSTGSSDTPMGTIQFVDGSTLLGMPLLAGSGPSAKATLTTSSLVAGSHGIEAIYVGVNGFAGSVSGFTNETIVPPTYSAALSPPTLTLGRGAIGSTLLTITPAGGYTGAFTVGCGTAPAHFSCLVTTPSVAINSTSAVNTIVTVGTNVASSALRPVSGPNGGIMLGMAGAPLLGGLALFARRKKRWPGGLLACVMLLSFAPLVALSGCSKADPFANDSPTGSFQVPITITPASGAATTVMLSVTVQ